MVEITYEVKGKTAVITLNIPQLYNALSGAEYRRLEQLVLLAAQNPDTIVTLIQGTGKFFSAGANLGSGSGSKKEDTIELKQIDDPSDPAEYENQKVRTAYAYSFGTRNLTITESFYNHPKVLVVALNGPVIGLTSSLVAMADFIYARDTAWLLTPFSNIGLAPEGAASFSLAYRLGHSKASELLLSSTPIDANELYRLGFVNKLYSSEEYTTESFNETIQKLIQEKFYHLHPESLIITKELMRKSTAKNYAEANALEVVAGTDQFTKGVPQKRFAALAKRELKHKL
ncbi:uncharacterized protein SAPINGB_P003607 [Magnusiomyces paraingens]|uniref:3-hydroxyisobutyryl-coenzyme A hydrolase n=1 Tax=Magnusiomyces paraingens TaxID=2606893 RepID=A0A5E8BXN4_9ASCO|nr:uncharacterized protein SAPINGB_P003607 [Saprochaete ingens]VVT53505.1 unnamed protein product [Saprochaete ingens]